MPMDMKECFKYRYGVEWDECEMRDTKFAWVMIWEHAKDYFTGNQTSNNAEYYTTENMNGQY